MSTLLFEHPVFEAQLLRTMSHTTYGGAEIGECLAAARRIPDGDSARWYIEWCATAERLYAQATASRAAGHTVSAREAFLRASNYFRTAYILLLGVPVDPRLVWAFDRQTEAFRQACALFSPAGEPISIAYEHTHLPGYFFRVDACDRPRATLILTGGYDSTVEELYFWNVAAALRRGYNCLCFDGPGQGAPLIKQQLVFRPDWERVVGPVVDYALTRADVDPARLALMGLSWGGYLAPRAASGEPRLAACIADPGEYDLGAALKRQLPPQIQRCFPDLDTSMWQQLEERLPADPRMAWVLRRALWVHGAATLQEYARLAGTFSLVDRANVIRCPTLVCAADDDPLAADAADLYAALRCPKAYVVFSGAEGAGEHCESGARALFHQRAFDWLDTVLVPTVAGNPARDASHFQESGTADEASHARIINGSMA